VRRLYCRRRAAPPRARRFSWKGSESRKRFTEIERPHRLAYASLADFIPGVDPYDFMTVIEITPDNGGAQVVMTMKAMHDDAWTERLAAGRRNGLENLANVIAAR
jgi:hypothetical protein